MTGKEVYNNLLKLGVPADDAKKLVATGYSESGMNNTIRGDGGNSIGLFQIHIPSHPDKLRAMTGTGDRNTWIKWLMVPENNIRAAAAVYHSQGLGAWTEYRNGHYSQFMTLSDSSTDLANISKIDFKASDLSLSEPVSGSNVQLSGSGNGNAKTTAFGFLGACAALSLIIIMGAIR